jgi:hypothetical protein
MAMEEIDKILYDLDQGNIGIANAKKQILELETIPTFYSKDQMDCPNCGVGLKIEVREMTNSDIIKAMQQNNSKA